MWPDAVSFDPLAGTASPAIEALLEGPGSAGPVVLLAVGPMAQRGGWAAHTAVTLADAFAARGESVILADLSLENPELHTLLGIDNDEGLTDVFLFGASLQHAARTIPGKWLRLIPASPFTPDAAEVLTHKDWSRVFEAMAMEQSKLVLYLPIDLDGAHALSDRVGHTIVLADPFDVDRVRSVLSEDADVIGVICPPEDEEAPEEPIGEEAIQEESIHDESHFEESPLEESPADESQFAVPRLDDEAFDKIRIPKDGARDALIADLRKRQREALLSPQPTMQPLPHEASREEAAAPRSAETTVLPLMRGSTSKHPAPPMFTMRAAQAQPKRSRTWLFAVLIVSLLAAASAGGWYWYQNRPAPAPAPVRARTPAPANPAPGSVPAPATAPAPANKLPYSVAVASYQLFKTAEDQRAQLQDEAGVAFYVAPIVVNGKTFYRLMAGPVADSASANALRDTLIAKRIKTISSGWDVLSTPYAFLIGEFKSRSDAEAKQRDAAKKNVPSYVVALKADDGSISYRVYAGAFTGPGDADFMRQVLKSAGLPDSLVERTGSIT